MKQKKINDSVNNNLVTFGASYLVGHCFYIATI